MTTDKFSKATGTAGRRNGDAYRYAGLFCIALAAFVPDVANAQNAPANLPPVQVDAPKQRTPHKRTAATPTPTAKRRTARSNPARNPAASNVSAAVDTGNGPNNNNSGPPLQQAPSLGKTGTKLADLPMSVQIIPREVVTE